MYAGQSPLLVTIVTWGGICSETNFEVSNVTFAFG